MSVTALMCGGRAAYRLAARSLSAASSAFHQARRFATHGPRSACFSSSVSLTGGRVARRPDILMDLALAALDGTHLGLRGSRILAIFSVTTAAQGTVSSELAPASSG